VSTSDLPLAEEHVVFRPPVFVASPGFPALVTSPRFAEALLLSFAIEYVCSFLFSYVPLWSFPVFCWQGFRLSLCRTVGVGPGIFLLPFSSPCFPFSLRVSLTAFFTTFVERLREDWETSLISLCIFRARGLFFRDLFFFFHLCSSLCFPPPDNPFVEFQTTLSLPPGVLNTRPFSPETDTFFSHSPFPRSSAQRTAAVGLFWWLLPSNRPFTSQTLKVRIQFSLSGSSPLWDHRGVGRVSCRVFVALLVGFYFFSFSRHLDRRFLLHFFCGVVPVGHGQQGSPPFFRRSPVAALCLRQFCKHPGQTPRLYQLSFFA